MAKIIDTHSHILPGIDDGAGSWKEALCMLKTAQAQGIRRVIATPHWGGPFGYTDPVQIRELCFTLQEKARRHNISVKIYQGQEVMYTEESGNRVFGNFSGSTALYTVGIQSDHRSCREI